MCLHGKSVPTVTAVAMDMCCHGEVLPWICVVCRTWGPKTWRPMCTWCARSSEMVQLLSLHEHIHTWSCTHSIAAAGKMLMDKKHHSQHTFRRPYACGGESVRAVVGGV